MPGKGIELIQLLKTGNSGEARKLVVKLKKQGKKKFLAALLEQDSEGCTPLHYCAAYNFLDFIEEFIEIGAVVDIEDHKGSTPLHLAAGNGRSESTSVLLCRGADPNIANRTGDTPCHLGAHNGHADVVEYLVREHAKCTIVNVSGQTPLDLACQNGHGAVVSILLRSGQFNPQRTEIPQTAMKLAAKHGHTEVLGLLIKHGFDINRLLPGAHGTCLHEAALYGKIETVNYLLRCGVDPSIKNTQGLTALDIVNHYTDPRSAHKLKQLLQDAMANQARSRIAQAHQHMQPHPPQGQPHPPQGQPSGHTQTPSHHSGYGQAYAQPHAQTQAYVQPQAYTQPQPQAYIQPQPQPQPQSYTQPQGYGQTQTQAYTQRQHSDARKQSSGQQGHAQQLQRPQTTPTTQVVPSQDLASQIAERAASRKPMSTSPTRRDSTEYHYSRSNTLAGGQRPHIDKALILKRRNSYSEDSAAQEHPQPSHERVPTLPRRGHKGPPTFKPVPPPEKSSGSINSPEVSHSAPPPMAAPPPPPSVPPPPVGGPPISAPPPPPPTGSTNSPQVQRPPSVSAPPTVTGPIIPGPGEIKLKKVSERPKEAAPAKEEPSFENELLAKLKRRQQTIDTPTPKEPMDTKEEVAAEDTPQPQPNTPQPQPESIKTTPTHQTAPPPAVAKALPTAAAKATPPDPASPPKPKPKVKQKQEEPKQLTWQEELARKKQQQQEKEERERQEKEQEEKEKREKEEKERREKEEKEQERKRLELEKQKSIPPVQPKPKPKRPTPTQSPSHSSSLQNPCDYVPGASLPKPSPTPGPTSPTPPTTLPTPGPTSGSTLPASGPTSLTSGPIPPTSSPAPLTSDPAPLTSGPPPPTSGPPPPTAGPAPPVPIAGTPTEIGTNEEMNHPSTPTSDRPMSRSTSIGSIQSVPIGTTPMPPSGFECIPIEEWLSSYKLLEYVSVMQESGYDNTDFLLGISAEELIQLGVSKPGHRKRLLGALSQLIAKEHFLTFKPASVAEWLQQLGLSEYETIMLESGYDDIDFITSVTLEELVDIGITKKGHLKRFEKGIAELQEMLKNDTPTVVSPYITQYNLPSSPSHSVSSSCSHGADVSKQDNVVSHDLQENKEDNALKPVDPVPQTSVASSEDSGIASVTDTGRVSGGSFSKMRQMLEKRMGGEDVDESSDEEETKPVKTTTPPLLKTSSEKKIGSAPPPIPKRAVSTVLTSKDSPLLHSKHMMEDQTDSAPLVVDILSGFSTVAPPKPKELTPPLPATKPKPSRGSKVLEDTDVATTTNVAPPSDATYTSEDIDSALALVKESTPARESTKSSHSITELDELDRVLQGMEHASLLANQEREKSLERSSAEEEELFIEENKTDVLLADIDTMLADLTTHLDDIIPTN